MTKAERDLVMAIGFALKDLMALHGLQKERSFQALTETLSIVTRQDAKKGPRR